MFKKKINFLKQYNVQGALRTNIKADAVEFL